MKYVLLLVLLLAAIPSHAAKMIVKIEYDALQDVNSPVTVTLNFRTDTIKQGTITTQLTNAQVASATPASVLTSIKNAAINKYFALESVTIVASDVLVFGAPQ